MADEFNGTTVTFPTTSATLGTGLRDCNFTENGADVDLTHANSTAGTGRPGITREEFSVTVLGESTGAQHGTNGKITVSWADGETDQIDKVYVSSRGKGGSMDGEVTTTYVFRRYST